MRCSKVALAAVLVVSLSVPAIAADETWTQVGVALGKAGTEMSGGVYRVALPRTDLKATLDGVEIKPGLALGGWLAFEKMGQDGIVMGDLVLTQDEVNPVMRQVKRTGARYASIPTAG